MPTNSNKKYNVIAVLSIFIISCLIFWKFFIYGLHPFPGDYMLAWYEPWKTEHFTNGIITISHKPVADDVFRQLYPFKILSVDLVRKLQLPLWNPYNGSGMPLMATMHVGYLNPFNVLLLLLSKPLGWSIYIIIQPILIGIFMYLYTRKLGLSLYASVFSTLTFTLSAFVVTRLVFGDYDYAIIGLPLLLYVMEKILQNSKSKTIFFIPLIIFFIFATTQPQIILYILIFTLCYAFYRYLQIETNIRHVSKKMLLIIFFYAIGIGLAGIQLILTFELFQQAAITTTSSKFIFERFLLPIQHLISILIPNYYGNQATYNYWGAGDYIETVAAIGIIPSFFAYVSFLYTNKKSKDYTTRKFFLFGTILTILSTIDWFGTRFLFSIQLPIISTGIPSRIFFLTTFSVAILSGYGFDAWLQSRKKLISVYKLIPFIGPIFILAIGAFYFYVKNIPCNNFFVPACRLIALRNTIFELIFFFLALFVFFWYLKSKKENFVRILPLAMITFIVVLGLYNSNKFIPFSSKETFLPKNYLIQKILENKNSSRVSGLGNANIKTDFATYFGFYDPNYYDPLYNKRYGELVSYANTGNYNTLLQRSDVEISNELTLDKKLQERRTRLLNILGTSSLIYKKTEVEKFINSNEKTIWEDRNWIIKENSTALPRVYLTSRIEVIGERGKILTRIFDVSFDPKTTVILENNINMHPSPAIKSFEQAKIVKYKENEVTIKTTSSENNILVLSDNYYPGWKAFVDNKETKIFRANYTFRAIQLPPGDHIVEFVYWPESLQVGMYISIFSLILYFFLIFLWKKISSNKN